MVPTRTVPPAGRVTESVAALLRGEPPPASKTSMPTTDVDVQEKNVPTERPESLITPGTE